MMRATVLVAIAATTIGSASAEGESPFASDEAARCAAVFAFTLDAMETASNVPRTVRNKMRDGLAIWEYELAASRPDASTEELQAVANRAVAYIRADMPDGEGPEGARQRGDFLTASATDCHKKIAVAYEGQEHPVIPFLREAEVTVGDASPAPVASPPKPAAAATALAETEAPKKGRGLR